MSCVILVPTWHCCRMLRHKFFHRAKKVPVSEQELKAKLKKKDKERKHDGGEEKCKKEEDKGDADAESSHAEGEKKEEKALVLSVSYGAQNVVVVHCCNLMWCSTHALLIRSDISHKKVYGACQLCCVCYIMKCCSAVILCHSIVFGTCMAVLIELNCCVV